MKGKQFITDKNHIMTELEVFPSLNMSRANTLSISQNAVNGFMGFGVAITGASCYNLSLMTADDRAELLESLYSPEKIGLSVGRLSIGASDYSAELYSYDDVAFDSGLKHFSIERDKKYIIPMIKEILKINPDLFLFASPWSPPYWMKTGENMCGGFMRDKYVDCYAEYFVKYLKAYADNGIKISAVTPQNELFTPQNGAMPACIWHPETEAHFINSLRKKLNENNMDVAIWMHDHSFEYSDQVLWELDNCGSVAAACDGVAFHYYGGAVEETLKIKRKYANLGLHFTEAGPRLYDNYDSDWCKWGIMISKIIKCGYSSFTGWNLMLNELGGPNIGPFLCGGLVTRNTENGELTYSGQYKAFKHISEYITKNSDIYPISVGEEYKPCIAAYPFQSKEIEGFCIDNKNGKLVFVLINPNAEKSQTQLCVNGTYWYIELIPDSISTIIIDLKDE